VRDLLKEGRIDEAIEVYRKFAGVDEYTAKDAVWKIEQDMKYEADAEARLSAEPEHDPYIMSLVTAGKKIEAIKVYRERTGTGLKEAKDAIDALERGQGSDEERNKTMVTLSLEEQIIEQVRRLDTEHQRRVWNMLGFVASKGLRVARRAVRS
jgi:ribosomal protein L7/L12